jgi:hypothetical protein
MQNNKKFRYVGVAPFTTQQQQIFFGREQDSQKLIQLITANQQVLLYSKSGMGKSSLINAGVVPQLPKEWQIIFVRFGAYQENDTFTLIEKLLAALPTSQTTYLDQIIENEKSLWYTLKSRQSELKIDNQITEKGVTSTKNTKTLLIFDQFEELFTYPEEQIFTFKKQMADLLYSNVPQNFRKVLQIKQRKDPNLLTEKELKALHQPLKVKILMGIREDRYSLLNQLTDYLPSVMQIRYSLSALDKEQAQEAIEKPAQMVGEFTSQSFTYQKEAIQKIVNYLTANNTQAIETTQLQILCHNLEKKDLPVIGIDNIPEFEDIFLQFYNDTIAKIATQNQAQARKFIENELVKKGQRVSVSDLTCLDSVDKTTLEILVGEHLLRPEYNVSTQRNNYELSHDTLLAPVLRAKELREIEEQKQSEKKRLETENKAALKKAEKDRIENAKIKENTKIKRQVRSLSIAFGIALLAVIAAIYFGYEAGKQQKRALRLVKEARTERDKAYRAEKKLQEALSIISYQTEIQELESIKSILVSDKKMPQAQEYQKQIDSVQQLIQNLK